MIQNLQATKECEKLHLLLVFFYFIMLQLFKLLILPSYFAKNLIFRRFATRQDQATDKFGFG
jgi:hypothetical protein